MLITVNVSTVSRPLCGFISELRSVHCTDTANEIHTTPPRATSSAGQQMLSTSRTHVHWETAGLRVNDSELRTADPDDHPVSECLNLHNMLSACIHNNSPVELPIGNTTLTTIVYLIVSVSYGNELTYSTTYGRISAHNSDSKTVEPYDKSRANYEYKCTSAKKCSTWRRADWG